MVIIKKPIIKLDIINWLLEEENPSVRYFTLVDLLHENRQSPKVVKAKQQIMKHGIVSETLARQSPDEYWD